MDPGRWGEIQAAFDALVELDLTARASRLEALGSCDPELRAAVESLLSADAEVDRRLAEVESTFHSVAMPAPDLLGLAGRTVSHFRILEPLGAGGMGVVYHAEDTRLGRPVVLKFLLPHFGLDASAKELFLREARSAAALDHPNLCTVHEVGESEDGRLFIAMTLYRGETLKARLAREGTLPVNDALAIAQQIADGLSCAHASGIVHRDLKPGNVMVLRDGTVKILDFGLAKTGDQNVNSARSRVGTAAYMAPEQVRGEAVDGRTDLWALGIILYEMITGQRPFRGENDVAIAHGILNLDPVAPSALSEIAKGTEDLVLTLLQKDPAKRYATNELLAHLAVDRSETKRLLPWAGVDVRGGKRTIRSKRAWPAVVGALAMVATFGVLKSLQSLTRQNAARNKAAASRVVVIPLENRTGVKELDPLGTMTAEWVTQGLTQVPFLTVVDTREEKPATYSAHGLVAVGLRTGAGVAVAGSYFLQGDSLHFQVQIASTADGSLLFVIGGVTTPRASPMMGVEEVQQRVSAAVASLLDRDVTAFQTTLREAPTYSAYREYVEGLESYMGRPGGGGFSEAARHFQQAASLDSTFLTARVWAAQSSTLEAAVQLDGEWGKRADSLLRELRPMRERLVPFDRARLSFVLALRGGDLVRMYRAALDMFDASPGSFDARREVAFSALSALRPRETLRRLSQLDSSVSPRFGWEAPYWSYVASAEHLLGHHDDELAAARRLRQLDPSDLEALYLELGALAALGRTAELDSIARFQLPGSGQSGLIAFGIAGELMAHGHADAAQRLIRYVFDHPGAPPPSNMAAAREWLIRHMALQRDIGVPYCYLGQRLEASLVVERAKDEWVHWRAELALLLGDVETARILATELRDATAHRVLLVRILAARGQLVAARTAFEHWEQQMLHVRGTLNGLELDRASVLVRLGDVDGALEVLSEGIGRRALASTTSGWDGHAYPDLAPLWGNPLFQDLIKPRG